jgi:two-component system LytT family sensor kinase
MSLLGPTISQQRQFWVLHLAGWTAWGAFKFFYTQAVFESTAPNYWLYVMIITVVAMLISLLLRSLYKALWERPLWVRTLAFLGGSAVAGYAFLQSRFFIYSTWLSKADYTEDWMKSGGDLAELYEKFAYLETYSSSLLWMVAWSVAYFALKYHRVFQEYRESALKSAAMAHEAQLKMLRYQLNPHFLFNTLNAISTLILEKDIEPANRMVTKLSSFLRYSLDNDPLLKITLAQELKALKLYLDIEKVRFEERLGLELDIEPEAERALIPSLLLQPLVENAIKYAIAKSEDGGTLRIAARVFAGDLLLEVSDNGPGVELEDGDIPGGTGVGLRNTRERLHELYGSHHSFRLEPADPSGLSIHIRVPYQTQQG